MRLWRVWVAQHCGRVIATSVEAVNPLGTGAEGCEKCQDGPPYTCETFNQATDVVLLPLGSYAALTAGIMFAKHQVALEEARAAALAGAPPRSTSCPLAIALHCITLHDMQSGAAVCILQHSRPAIAPTALLPADAAVGPVCVRACVCTTATSAMSPPLVHRLHDLCGPDMLQYLPQPAECRKITCDGGTSTRLPRGRCRDEAECVLQGWCSGLLASLWR